MPIGSSRFDAAVCADSNPVVTRDEIESWPDVIDAVVATTAHFDRARVVRETGSTQDVARASCGGRPGLVVVAGRQTSGRGQRGRAWEQRGDMGVAATCVVAAGESGHLSRVAGLAALDACTEATGGRATGRRWVMGLKSPNDVVVDDGGVRRKLAGILIEQGDGLAFIGVGINVSQAMSDFAGPLSRTAVSLNMLGTRVARIEVVLGLVASLDRWLGAGEGEARRAWESSLRTELDPRWGAGRE